MDVRGDPPFSWRDFQTSRTIPGYAYLLLKPTGYGLHTIRDKTFVDLKAEFANGGLGGTHVMGPRDDGSVWGVDFADRSHHPYRFRRDPFGPMSTGGARRGLAVFLPMPQTG